MEMKVLGSGCANCNKLVKILEEAAEEVGISGSVQKVTDIQEIMSYGVMSTPALVIDGKIKSSGRVPSKDEVKKFLQGGQGESSCGCKDGCCR